MNYLAFDIGGSNTKFAFISDQGEISGKKQVSTPDSYDDLIAFIINTFQSSGVDTPFIGLSCPGIYDPLDNQITGSSALDYLIDRDIVGDLECRFPNVSVWIENDGNCALLGEVWQGHAHGVQDAAIIVVGSAIGGGAMVNGQLLRGSALHAGEFGYMMIDNDIKTPSYHSLGGTGGMNGLIQFINQAGYQVTNGIDLFEQLEVDDDLYHLVESQLLFTAIGIINIQYMLDPAIVIIGGAISQNARYIDMLHQALDKVLSARPLYKVIPRVTAAKNNNDANLLGIVYKRLYFGQVES